jgi:serine/threonine protein kinase
MDLVQGQSLKQVLKERGGRLHISEIDWIVDQIVEGVATLHEHTEPIVHLDLKPSNVMIEGSRVVLVDFGSAKLARHRQGTLHITPAYAPPELLGTEWGPESDIYELGMMVYEMLTGRRPPSALDRIDGAREWRPGPEAEPWQEMLEQALAERDKRPTDVRAWWAMRGERAEADSTSMTLSESRIPPLGSASCSRKTDVVLGKSVAFSFDLCYDGNTNPGNVSMQPSSESESLKRRA